MGVRRSVCVNGHEKTPENTSKNSSCLICQKHQNAERRKIRPEIDVRRAERQRAYYASLTPDQLAARKEKQREWNKNNLDKLKAIRENFKKNNPRHSKESRLKHLYGLSLEDHEKLIAQHGSRCAICATTEPGGAYKNTWNVDHCHATGKVRGILCHRCNTGLGKFKDDSALLTRAIAYLNHPR